MDDAEQFAQQVVTQCPPGIPIFLGGQSLGALVITLAALRNQDPWAGLVLASAGMDVEWTWILRYAFPLLVRCLLTCVRTQNCSQSHAHQANQACSDVVTWKMCT